MKKVFLSWAMALCVFGISAQVKNVDLSEALRFAASDICNGIPEQSVIGVVKFSSDSREMSDYLAENMTSAIKNTGKFRVVERSGKNLALINSEIDFQYSGEVSDNSVVDLGEKLGAQYLVYGTFEQFGGMLQLTVRTANVSTAEIPVLSPFSITPNSLITQLLGDGKELVTAEDYLDMIARCHSKLSSIQKDKNREIQKNVAAVSSKYQNQLNNVNAQEQEPWESTEEYNNRIATEAGVIVKKRDTELSGIEKSVSIRYDGLYKSVEIQMEKIARDLQTVTFVLNGDSVQVMIGAFDREAKPKNWPISIKSLDKMVNFTYNENYVVNDADVKSEYQKVEAWKAAGSLNGEITYQLVQSANKKVFDVKVLNVRVYDTASGSTMLNVSINQNAGTASTATKSAGKSGTEQTAQAGTEITESMLVDSDEYENASFRTAEIFSSVISTSLDPANTTPFENPSLWRFGKGANGSGNITSTVIGYAGRKYSGVRFSGNTGMWKEFSTDFVEACNNSKNLIKVLAIGNTVEFKVLGDGNNWKFIIDNYDGSKNWSRFSYSFKTKKNSVTKVVIPYKRMKREEWSTFGKLDLANTSCKWRCLFSPDFFTLPKNIDYEITFFDCDVYIE